MREAARRDLQAAASMDVEPTDQDLDELVEQAGKGDKRELLLFLQEKGYKRLKLE